MGFLSTRPSPQSEREAPSSAPPLPRSVTPEQLLRAELLAIDTRLSAFLENSRRAPARIGFRSPPPAAIQIEALHKQCESSHDVVEALSRSLPGQFRAVRSLSHSLSYALSQFLDHLSEVSHDGVVPESSLARTREFAAVLRHSLREAIIALDASGSPQSSDKTDKAKP